jgi:hypothetical protein
MLQNSSTEGTELKNLKELYYKLQTYNRMNSIIKINVGKQMTRRMHNIILKATLKHGSEM